MKTVATAALWIVGAWMLLVAASFIWQERLLYLPAHATLERVATDSLQAWPSAQDFRGLVAEPAAAVRATAIVFHGNAGHAGHRAFYAQALSASGLRVILAEYPGYGPRPGEPRESRLVADAEETLALAHRQYGAPLLVVGESLGAAVAAAAAARRPELVAGLLLITPWDRLDNVAALHYPWLPVRSLLREGYDNVTALSGFDRPTVVVVAEDDRIVPARFGLALHAALGEPKHLLVIENGDHNDWAGRVTPAWWRAAVAMALDETPRHAPSR
jgi:hypothetical protein